MALLCGTYDMGLISAGGLRNSSEQARTVRRGHQEDTRTGRASALSLES